MKSYEIIKNEIDAKTRKGDWVWGSEILFVFVMLFLYNMPVFFDFWLTQKVISLTEDVEASALGS